MFRKVVCLPPSGSSINILPWVCWSLWLSKNQLLFEAKGSTPEEVALKSLTYAREWISAQTHQKPDQALARRVQTNTQEARRIPNLIRCQTDASWQKDTRRAGLGWIFYNGNESILRGSEAQDFVGSPLIAETLACRSSLRHAISTGFENLRVLSDNQTLVRAINSELLITDIFGIIADIKVLSASFSSISFAFVSRSANEEADSLSRQALSHASFVSVTGL
ncbi:hypothetical protein IGI04_025313 [Brassica rapa subsp. trilocularis]|uniref:RNase H type-1 domain-containing protein n=1 Tax=Brassica rapa subsp. trilocularis TaxID=1813537 RepID=A0ABQ7MBR4_BRACM|nr:hypothetical protein IGI04_025313 [Brassica rapa subsp. trilocularis]